MVRAEIDMVKIQSQEAIAEMKIAQDREEALMKEKENIRKSYNELLKDVRSSDTQNRGI